MKLRRGIIIRQNKNGIFFVVRKLEDIYILHFLFHHDICAKVIMFGVSVSVSVSLLEAKYVFTESVSFHLRLFIRGFICDGGTEHI